MGSPRVDFYVVTGGRGANRVACRVAEKAFHRGMTVLIRTGTRERAQAMDELLWTFSGASFVPHALSDDPAPDVTVLIGAELGDREGDLLINLSDEPPPAPERYPRIAEVVGPGESERRSGRQRFRYYRDQLGIEPETHRIGR